MVLKVCLNCQWFCVKRSGTTICNLDGHYAQRFDRCDQWYISKQLQRDINSAKGVKNG